MRRAPYLPVFLPLFLVACSNAFEVKPNSVDLLDSGGDDDTDTSDTDTGQTTTTRLVSGVVVGADGLPLAGVTVAGGSAAVTTTTDGTFSVSKKGAASLSLSFTAGGRYSAARTFVADAAHVRVGLLPKRVPIPVNVALGGTVTVAGVASVVVPAAALGEAGIYAVTLDPLDLTAGTHVLPAGESGEGGEVAMVYAAVVVGLKGPEGAVTASVALPINLLLNADSPGTSAQVLRESSGVWTDTGTTASIALDGTAYTASFTVTESGTYAVGRLDAGGCVSGTAVDGNGAPAPGALVRSYVRPDSAGVAGYLGEALADASGAFCVPGSAGGVTVRVDYTDTAGAVWAGSTDASGAGSADTCESCNDLGNLQLSLAGCATGNLYAPDGGTMLPSPFVWEEGDVVTSSVADDASSLTFYARSGATFHLTGPGGLSKAFSVEGGSTPEAADCARLGNLQALDQCVMVDVAAEGVALEDAVVSSSKGGWSTTDSEGNVCIPSDDGTVTFTADWTVGGQSVSAEESLVVSPSNGSCQAGECFAGPSLALPDAGCVTGTIRGEGGVAAAGITVWSSSWDSTTTAADGTFSLTTAGYGSAAVWAEGWGVTPFTDGPASAGCAALSLYSDAGAAPPLVIASGKNIWRINSDFSRTDLKLGAVVDIADLTVDTTANLLIGLLNVYVWAGEADATGWTYFDVPSQLWSAVRISPDGGSVALQGYGASNPSVWIYEPDGTSRLKLSASAGTDNDGLAWSADSNFVASTRKDDGIEVTPANGSRGATTIAASPCAHPVWFDADSVALECNGDMKLYEMDGSSSTTWHSTTGAERIWAVTSTARVVYTRDDELHIANIDDSSDVTLYTGTSGTTYSKVRVSADGLWVAAIVTDPTTGTDVLAVADQAPYTPTWLTSTPTEIESAVDWPD